MRLYFPLEDKSILLAVLFVEYVDWTAGIVVVGEEQGYPVVFGGEGDLDGLAVALQQGDLDRGTYSF